jgi:enoyl-CoA hydratase/carnithine racemase
MSRGNGGRDYLAADFRGGVLCLTLSRPELHNALHPPACAELGYALDEAQADAEVRVVVITGAGVKAFSAGFDLQYAEQHPEIYREPLFASEIVRRPPAGKPLIAAVNGLALGLGFELALACDLVIAARHAKFGLPEAAVGLAAMGGGVVRLSRQIGHKRALGIALTSRMVSADEGLQLGFVNEVTDEPVLDAAQRWAAQIMRGAPLSIAASLQMAYRGTEIEPLSAALDPQSYPAAMAVLGSEDAREGRQAFLQKRAPQWTNR